jgi:malic enzyme
MPREMIPAYAIVKKGAERNVKQIMLTGMINAVKLKGTKLKDETYLFLGAGSAGMAIFATQAKRVTDEMFIEAGQAVADQVPAELLKQGLLYPLQSDILETEIKTAARVTKVVFESNLACVESPADYEAFIRSHVYKPAYRSFI